MKILKQVSSIFKYKEVVEEVEEIVVMKHSASSGCLTIVPQDQQRRRSLPTNLEEVANEVFMAEKAARKEQRRASKTISHTQVKKRQDVINKFVRQGSFLRKTLEAQSQSPAHKQPAGFLAKTLESQPPRKQSTELASVDTFSTDVTDSMDLSLTSHSTHSMPVRLANASPTSSESSLTMKTISWASDVDQDMKRRALSSKQRRNLPDNMKRQMAHRVHLCNQRKKEWQEFHKDYIHGKQEIQVAPVQEDWLKSTKQKEITDAEKFMVMEVDLFGTGEKNKIRVNQSKIKHVRQASF